MRYRPNRDCVSVDSMIERVDVTDRETGVVVCQNFFPMNERLAPSEMFDTELMIRSGVPLKQTNTKVLGSGVMAVAEALNDIDDEKI